MRTTSLQNLFRRALGMALLSLCLSSPALAQPAAPGTPNVELQAQATLLYTEGTKAAKLNQWEKARTFYLSAWRVQPHWQIAGSLGRAEFKTGKLRDAAEHLAYFLREASRLGEGDRKTAAEMLEKARSKVSSLTISVNQAGAEISVDGASVGTAPLQGEVFVEPGPRVVEAKLPGFVSAQATEEARAGSGLRIDLQLEKIEPAKPMVVVPSCPPPPKPPPVVESSRAFIVVGAVASGLAAGAGVALAVASEVERGDRGTPKLSCKIQEECDRYNSAEVARAAFGNAAIASGIAASVLGIATLTYALATRKDKPKDAARADLILGPGTAKAVVTLVW